MPSRDPERSTRPSVAAPRWRLLTPGLGVFVVAATWYAIGLAAEPAFVDESAYYSQSFYAGLLARGEFNDLLWFDYPAYDLPPLPKYLIGAAVAIGGGTLPGPAEARAWYGNTSLRFDRDGSLTLARIPSVLVGALGCLAVYGLGTMALGRPAGLVAAFLLMINPLYQLHARRAMSDVPTEAFQLLGLLAALFVWKRSEEGRLGASSVAAAVAAGLAFGLSISSKFSGLLGPMTVAAWAVLALVPGANFRRAWRFVAMSGVMALVAALVFVGLNPFLTARPENAPPQVARLVGLSTWERIVMMYQLRRDVSASQQTIFPHNALNASSEKVATTAVQGFGRFGPFGPSHSDSTIRFDRVQDWGALFWLPWVAIGTAWSFRRGLGQLRAGEPPTAWALLVQFLVALVVVTVYVPMAWDRYFLAIQAPSAIQAAGLAVSLAGACGAALRRGEEPVG